MKIPSKVVIKGKIWNVSYKWHLKDIYEENQPKCDGLTVWDEHTIYLERTMTKEEKFKVLGEEICHIMIDEFQLNQVISPEVIEIFCHGVMGGLFDIYNLKFKTEHFNVVSRSRK